MATGGRKTQYQAMHQISVQLGPASPIAGVVGVLPVGAIIDAATIFALTAFNSTTNTLALGTTPGGTQILAATDLKTVARTPTNPVPPTGGPFSVDTPIYYTLGSTGAAPTAGAAIALVQYLPGPG
jgi:hypothetical protein